GIRPNHGVASPHQRSRARMSLSNRDRIEIDGAPGNAHAVPARPFSLVLATSASQTGFWPAFLFSSGCPCANVERTPGATYMSATGKVGTLHRHPHAAPQALAPAALACMGVVFGDIGTSPLYTVSVTLKASSSGGTVAPEAVLGIVSLIFWSLIVV